MFGRMLSLAALIFVFVAMPAIAQEKPGGPGHSVGPAVAGIPGGAEEQTNRAIRFDVVSIKPAGPNENWQIRSLPDGISIVGSVTNLIYHAYFPMNMADRDAVSGAPGWANSELWHIDAKVAPEDLGVYQQHRFRLDDPPSAQGKQMLQALLADRFHLVVHRVPAEMDGYALVIAKNGPKLTEAAPDEPQPAGSIPIAGGGYITPYRRGEFPHTQFHAVTMSSFAVHLRGNGCAVVDRTGLTGKYDFTLNWLSSGPDETHVGAIEFDDPDKLSHWDFGALGLRAERVKLPTEHIVIDHVDRPSPN